MTEFHRRCEDIAARFLQTVVIVDDEAYIEGPSGTAGPLVTPTRRMVAQSATDKAEELAEGEREINHRLNAGVLVETFSRRGLICAVIAPRFDEGGGDASLTDMVAPAVKRADIVILDWRLNNDSGKKTMSILKNILERDTAIDPGGRLRLVAVYTGEQNLSGIGGIILEGLEGFVGDKRGVVLSRGHCRITIYAKSDTPLAPDLSDRSVSESELPARLIGDFTQMTEGLLPGIALTSLAVIRENSHRILDRFDAALDPAFLTHRACLPFPDDSQQHMATQFANELHALISDAVATANPNPADMEAVEDWLNSSLGPGAGLSFGEGKVASREETIELLRKGFERAKPNCLSKKTGFRRLTGGFSKGVDEESALDRRLAWMFNFRTVFNAPSPILRLGSVLRRRDHDSEKYFVCMRPTCDSVRLQEETTFLLLPLVEPLGKSVQIVLRTGADMYRRVSVSTRMNQWLLVQFAPSLEKESVVAEHEDLGFFFTASSGDRFEWLGELKASFAQRLAQELASGLSRVAVDDSEWLRGEARA